MNSAEPMTIQHLPLAPKHVQNQAKLGHFGSWEVPLYFRGILEEHEAVRTAAGLFDISHMGKFFFSGPEALAFLDGLLPRSVAAMKDGQALYMPLLNEAAGILDDIILYRVSQNDFIMIVNAGNTEKDFAWIKKHVPSGVVFRDETPAMGLIALQGPAAGAILKDALKDDSFSGLSYYHFARWKDGMIARTGYTGEDGFEIMASLKAIESLWDSLFEAGKSRGLQPLGFGARDTLRLEAGMPLYGHDMAETENPFELGIGWAVDLTKPAFMGKEALVRIKAQGLAKRLVGFEMVDRGIPRQDYEIRKAGKTLGKVTSGTFSPTLKKNIGMGYVPVSETEPGNEIEVLVRDKALKAKIVKLPFYKRKK